MKQVARVLARYYLSCGSSGLLGGALKAELFLGGAAVHRCDYCLFSAAAFSRWGNGLRTAATSAPNSPGPGAPGSRPFCGR